MCLIDSNFSGSLMDEKFEIAEWKGCQIVTFKVVTRRDYYAVTKGFPLVSAPVAESEFDDFKGANASAPMNQDEVKWPIYNPALYGSFWLSKNLV
jgi:hypothetical protein